MPLQPEDIRFMGFHLSETARLQQALGVIQKEKDDRRPDIHSKGGYAPSEDFTKAVSALGILTRQYTEELREKAFNGEPIDVREKKTLAAAWELYVRGKTYDPDNEKSRLSLLASGKDPFTGRLPSGPKLVEMAAARTEPREKPLRDVNTIRFGL